MTSKDVGLMSDNQLRDKQVQLMNHIVGYNNEPDDLYFLAQNITATVQIKYDLKSGQQVWSDEYLARKGKEKNLSDSTRNYPSEVFKRNSMDVFQKIWNTNGIKSQK